MQTVGWILLGVIVALGVAAVRDTVEHLLTAVLGLPARLLDTARSGLVAGGRALTASAERARATLAYGSGGGAPAWDVVAPLVYLVLLVPIAVGDLVLAGLRFGALLGIPVDVLPISGSTLDMLTGLLFLAVLTTFGCVLFDVLHVTPLRRPYGIVQGAGRRLVLGLAAGGTVLSVVAAMIFFIWGQDAILGRPSSDLATLFIAMFAIALVGASILAAGGALGAVGALWSLLCSAGATVLAVLAWVVELLVTVVQGLHRTAVAAVRLLARPGRIAWNWFVALPAGTAARLAALPDPAAVDDLLDRPRQDLLALAGS